MSAHLTYIRGFIPYQKTKKRGQEVYMKAFFFSFEGKLEYLIIIFTLSCVTVHILPVEYITSWMFLWASPAICFKIKNYVKILLTWGIIYSWKWGLLYF